MNPILRNVLAVVAGIIFGSAVNMVFVFVIGPKLIPLPEGVTVENLAVTINQLKPIHFMSPFLAHALGTLAGAYVTARLAATSHMKLALGVGAWFLLGGIAAVMMLGGPLWFKALDLLVAYFPMALLGGKFGTKTPTTVAPQVAASTDPGEAAV